MTAKDLKAARSSFLLNCLSLSIILPALTYVGMGMMAYYHDHPEALRLKWIVNLNPKTEAPFTYGDRKAWVEAETTESSDDETEPIDDATEQATNTLPEGVTAETVLIDQTAADLSPEGLQQLIAERRLLKPNSREPFLDYEEILVPGTDKVDIQRLVTRKTPQGKLKRGRVLVAKNTSDELMPAYISDKLAFGIAGLIMAALLAATMSSLDSGLNSISNLLVSDVYAKSTQLRAMVAKKLGKEVDQLQREDELYVGRRLVLIIGVAATFFGLAVSQIGDIFAIITGVVNTFGAPLMTVILLGIFHRRVGAGAALATLICGTIFSIAMFAWVSLTSMIDQIWVMAFSVAFTYLFGLVISFALPNKKSREEMRGLVVGVGKLGVRDAEEAAAAIEIPTFGRKDRWK